ncbi:MAG: 2-hydroxy-3-oxopropionate reductase, partial [Clostridia bacterium]|nr:2-hydroxy-3-oxopropionate reductase [Clostridia bacterium]
MKIGFIGLGIMGRPMALNLIRGGHQLVVWQKSGAAEELVAAGAQTADSYSELAAGVELVILMLPDSPQVEQVVLGEQGVL